MLPGEELDAGGAICDALVDGTPRLVVSAAIVLVRNIERINLKRVQMDLVDSGAPGRLPWLSKAPCTPQRPTFLKQGCPIVGPPSAAGGSGTFAIPGRREDLTGRYPEGVGRAGSEYPEQSDSRSGATGELPVANSWGIVTRLQLHDFIDALRSAADDDYAFISDLDGRWQIDGLEKTVLKLIGSAALMLQSSYARITKDADVLQVEPLTPELCDRLEKLAGRGSELDRRHNMYLSS